MKSNGIKFVSDSSSAIGFDLVDLAREVNSPCTLTLYGQIKNNYWAKNNGTVEVTPQVILDDFEIEENSIVLSPLAQKLANKAANR